MWRKDVETQKFPNYAVVTASVKVNSFLLEMVIQQQQNSTEVYRLSLARKSGMWDKDKIHEAITKGWQLMIEICTIFVPTFPDHSSFP